MLERVSLERRDRVSAGLQAAAFTGAILLAMALSVAILLMAGVPTGALFDELVLQVFLTGPGLARTLTIATPMMLVALSAALCLRLKFWNIGIEGQVQLGAICATAVALLDLGGPFRLPVMLLAGGIGGAAWILLPVLLKIRAGVSEVIVTLLMSNIAFLLLQHLLFGPMGDPAHNFPTSPIFDAAERLPRFGFGDVNAGLPIAVLALLSAALMIHRLRFGFAARFAGDNPRAARALGYDTGRLLLISILLGGAAAGLAGSVIVTGTEFRLSQAVGMSMTFNGIVIAALARNDPLLIPVASLFMAGLSGAGASLKVFYGVSEGIVLVIQGIFLMCLVTCQFATTYRIALAGRVAP
ncbi:ABC transporter permease [Meridianimarinicoccus roseus]|uniref:ABC transporter permease n=1 Tax=Meridianimarinicoccus roseus TaxID=2072018 RepID=A0A2V2LID4_9RHOB|nr:ABC transporter permease [Meridianimarinicoccus roseus]PWR03771.1 ABC transporter permease [Meridianimarinicoccus roseus]